MPIDAQHLADAGLNADFVQLLLDEHHAQRLPRLERLWDYYRNEPVGDATDQSHDCQSLPQTRGLPHRLRTRPSEAAHRREIVIENDIAWRLQAMVDFMFGQPIAIQSCAADDTLARDIESLLQATFGAAGGIAFFQDMALLGAVYGFVDVLVRLDEASRITIDLVEPTRTVPVVNADDYRRLDAYLVHFRQPVNELADDTWLSRLGHRMLGRTPAAQRATVVRTELWTAGRHLRLVQRDGATHVAMSSSNRLGRLPVVHIQNLPQPFAYEGLSEVEPLMPLQDELNTRLSDRANRVTFQSFKMYLGKGIESFIERPVGPGQMWQTDNPDASITEFGGDGHNPSEDAHILEVRDAMDKISGVSPLAAGVIRSKIGNLTSENALRVTMMGLLAKTQRKRVTYGAGIERLCDMILHAANLAGTLRTEPADRRVRIDWPSALPENDTERLTNARLKLELGVPREQVLLELGYGDCAPAAPLPAADQQPQPPAPRPSSVRGESHEV